MGLARDHGLRCMCQHVRCAKMRPGVSGRMPRVRRVRTHRDASLRGVWHPEGELPRTRLARGRRLAV